MSNARKTPLVGALVVLVALLAGIWLALIGILAPSASATSLLHPETRVAAIAEPAGQLVGPSYSVLAGESRQRAPNYDQNATGSSVAAEGDSAGSELTQTAHGLERSFDPSRLSAAEQQNVIANFTQEFTQGDGADVYVQQVGDRYNVVVQGQNGVITNLKGISESSLNRLASNYGWVPK
ncbi:MAG: hypothetical protein ACLPYW_10135 [Acidimicrobiales bacterium]